MGKEHVHFNVCLGNPPYQIDDGGNGKSAKPVYNLFVEEAKKIATDSISYIMPAKWYSGGKGLDQFRTDMLSDERIKKLIDFENYKDVFPNLGGLAGGACIFLWDKHYNGPCAVENFRRDGSNVLTRPLNEFDTFIRQNQAVEIVRKINEMTKGQEKLSSRISSRKPFGIPTNYEPKENGLPCWYVQKVGLKYANPEDINDPKGYLNKWKFLIPPAPIAGQTDFTKPVAFFTENNTRISKPGECCTESWLVAGAFDTKEEVENYKSYLMTKIARFLLLQSVVSQHISTKTFKFIPDFGSYKEPYSDEMLRKLWSLSDDEWAYIDSRIS